MTQLLGVGTSLSSFATSKGLAVEVNVNNLQNEHGVLAYALFNKDEGFPTDKTKALKKSFVEFKTANTSNSFQFRIDEVPPGRYALIIFQDKNQNHILDKNFLGIPQEPVGASNNPKYHFGPPNFNECTFEVHDSVTTLDIKLVN